MENQIGKIIKSYELEGLVGTGGFGAVYRARQASVSREVAIKIIWPAFANHPNFIRRFEAEAQLVAGLEHPYIVPLYDYWRDPEGAYIVMRYLRGGHLRGVMDGTAWSIKRVNHVLENVATALAMAHRYGVVHRDIKPENILLDEDGNAYLADFGIAQILSNAKDEDDFAGMGSPAYAAPEQIVGGGLVSSQSDIYSLGVVLFELLTGQHPFPELDSLTMTSLTQLRASSPLPPLISRRIDLPPALNEVIQKATHLDPKMRYPDALTLSLAFREASGQNTISVVTNGKRTATSELVPNPYKGLRSFQESDANLFFGREALIRRLVARLWENEDYNRFLAVVGPSGSGKSSVVKAGLMPALRQGILPNSQNWYYADFTPGTRPFEELASVIQSFASKPPENLLERLQADDHGFLNLLNEVLPSDDTEVMILIDQFEEIFTLVTDAQETDRFIGALYQAVTDPSSRVRLVVTIRADFYDRPLLQPRISDLVRERTEVVVPMSPTELERVIIEPANKVGVTIDSGLVASIIAEVQEQPGALPLLQYALSELFERREGYQITLQAYKAIGGVRGALARRADEIYTKMDNTSQIAVRQLFLRLITLGEGTEDTRRRALMSEVTAIQDPNNLLGNNAVMKTVVDTLGRARLLTFDRDPVTRTPTVEVTHEAIIREWGRLREWLDESRNDVRLQRALSTQALEWYNANYDPSFLLRGIRLQQYERWKQTTNVALTESERVFLETSIAERKKSDESEKLRQERERRLEQQSLNFLRLIIAGLIVIVVGAVALTGFALGQRGLAEVAAQNAEENANISRSIAFASSAQNALSNNDGDLAIILALQANTVPNPPIDARSALAEVALSRGTRKILQGHDAPVLSVAMSTNGELIASGSSDATVRVWDAATGELRFTLSGQDSDVKHVTFSPDGNYVISGGTNFTAVMWDTTTGELIKKFVGNTTPINRVSITPDGNTLITAANDGLIILWDMTTGTEKMRFAGHTEAVVVLAVAPDGQMVLSGSRNGKLLYWELASGTVRMELAGHTKEITGLDIRTEGNQAVSSSGDGTMLVWDLATGQIVLRFLGETQEQNSVKFLDDSPFVITGTLSGAVEVWSVESGLRVDRLLGHTSPINAIALSEDGQFAVSGSNDRTLRLWNIRNPGEMAILEGHTERIDEMVRGSQTDNLYTASADGTLRVWSPSNVLLKTLTFTDLPISALAINANETQAIIGSRDGVAYLVDLATGTLGALLDGHSDNVMMANYLPDGTRALTTSQNGEIILWDLINTNVQMRYPVSDTGSINGLAILPDGKRFIVSLGNDSLVLYDTDAGSVVRVFGEHSATINSIAINADGTLLVSVARDGLAIVWDIQTGQERGRLTIGTDSLLSVTFNAMGDKVAMATNIGDIVVWDVLGTDILQDFRVIGRVFALVFASDGKSLYSGQDNGTVDQWRVFNGDEAVLWAQANRYVGELDCFERERYRVEPYCSTATPN